MSRHTTVAGQRGLSLTEELERLEQSITLTLQEIDHNFSKAHRIVTSSILPLVQQYAEHSQDMWENSKFWKQFFETSANVSLSGYEEKPTSEETEEQSATGSVGTPTHTTLDGTEPYSTPGAPDITSDSLQDIDLSNLTMSPSHSTPRPGGRQQKDDVKEPNNTSQGIATKAGRGPPRGHSSKDNPRTPIKQTQSFESTTTPEGSPREARQKELAPNTATRSRHNPILHTVLDRNYRIQATPLAVPQTNTVRSGTPAATRAGRRTVEADSSPLAPPELHAEVFDSPIRKSFVAKPVTAQQRTPGVSVLTPSHDRQPLPKRTPALWDSDDDDDAIDEQTGLPFGASPPKTMSFHVPQNRLLRTPAKEASKQIVNNILASAGAARSNAEDYEFSEDFDIDLDVDENYHDEEDSPSVVRQAANIEDETFG